MISSLVFFGNWIIFKFTGGTTPPLLDPSKSPITSEEQTFDSDDCRGQATFEPGPWTKARELIRPVVQRHKIKFDHLVLGFLSQVLVFSCVNCPYIKFCTNVLAIASKILKFKICLADIAIPTKEIRKERQLKFQVSSSNETKAIEQGNLQCTILLYARIQKQIFFYGRSLAYYREL